MKTVLFYEDKYYMFSNFSAHAVTHKGVLYPTTEHAYHAEKFDDEKIRKEILNAQSPLEAKNIANIKYKKFQKKNWHSIKVKVMYEIVKAKVLQQPEVKETLLSTGNDEIAENSPVDYFWGLGKDKTGQNQMGKILMKIRDELNSKTI